MAPGTSRPFPVLFPALSPCEVGLEDTGSGPTLLWQVHPAGLAAQAVSLPRPALHPGLPAAAAKQQPTASSAQISEMELARQGRLASLSSSVLLAPIPIRHLVCQSSAGTQHEDALTARQRGSPVVRPLRSGSADSPRHHRMPGAVPERGDARPIIFSFATATLTALGKAGVLSRLYASLSWPAAPAPSPETPSSPPPPHPRSPASEPNHCPLASSSEPPWHTGHRGRAARNRSSG